MKASSTGRVGRITIALLLGVAARAEPASGDAMERDRIRFERAAAEASYQQQVQLCSKEFVTTACVDAARAQRHAALMRLDKQQQVLDDARRKQRASERLQAIDSKVGGDEARRREAAAQERSANRRGSEDPVPAVAAASAAPPHNARVASSGAERAALEARARRAYELKQLQAEAHRQEVARRNEEQARKAKPAVSLPVPPASAASAVVPKTDSRQR